MTQSTSTMNDSLKQLSEGYDPKVLEQGLYDTWEQQGYFVPDFDKKDAFAIALPPPNVTGSLHLSLIHI